MNHVFIPGSSKNNSKPRVGTGMKTHTMHEMRLASGNSNRQRTCIERDLYGNRDGIKNENS